MDRSRSWTLAYSLLVGIVSAIESSGECVLTTTTVYLPTTIYVFAPNITSSHVGDSCIATSSSITIGTPTNSGTGTTDVAGTSTSTPSVPTSSSGLSTTIPSTSLTSISVTPTSQGNSSITTGSSVHTSTGFPTPTSIGGLPPPPPPPPSGPFNGFKNTVYFTNWCVSPLFECD